MRIFLHLQKLFSMYSHFAKCTTFSKCIRRWLTAVTSHDLPVYVKSAKMLHFSRKEKIQAWSQIIYYRPLLNLFKTCTCDSSSKNCMLRNCMKCLKPGLSSSDFKADVYLISFLQWQGIEKKIVKVNEMMPFDQLLSKYVEAISNLKRHIYRKC